MGAAETKRKTSGRAVAPLFMAVAVALSGCAATDEETDESEEGSDAEVTSTDEAALSVCSLGTITFYEHANYLGRQLRLCVGYSDYDLRRHKLAGGFPWETWNDRASSIKVESSNRTSLVLCEHINYQSCYHFVFQNGQIAFPDLRRYRLFDYPPYGRSTPATTETWNDRVSSFKWWG